MKRIALLLLIIGLPGLAPAEDYLKLFRHSQRQQEALDSLVANFCKLDSGLADSKLRIALIDLRNSSAPVYAHISGDIPVYPASVVKFVYLIAAFKWEEQGKLKLTEDIKAELRSMIHQSSNKATQKIFALLTDTEPGPPLSGSDYLLYREKKQSIKHWLESIGITGLHTVHPTYDGSGDISGREAQFLRDSTVKGGLASDDGTFTNRQAMTALGTAKLLALLIEDRIFTPERSREVLRYMYRDVSRQPYQLKRIAGGAARLKDFSVYSKSGTWGPIFADAGIIEDRAGSRLILVVFIERTPAYRGNFIADLTQALLERLNFKETTD